MVLVAVILLFETVSANTAEFSSNMTTGSVPLLVEFTDTSTNVSTSWLWEYQNATMSWMTFSTSQNPTFIFLAIGTYDVRLTITNTAGNDTETKTGYITVTNQSLACPVKLYEMYNVTGDGSDEGTKLRDAIVYSTTNTPCPIIFPENKVIVFNGQLSLGADTEVIGNCSTLKMIDNWTNGGTGRIGWALRLGERNYVHNLKFDGNRAHVNATVGTLNIDNILLGNDARFENNEVFNTMAYGTYTYKNNNITVKNNFFHDGNQYGISFNGEDITYTENVTVYNNTFWNFSDVGIKIRGCSNCAIANNTIIMPDGSWSSASGINLYSIDYPNRNVTITNNTIYGDFANTTGAGDTVGINSFRENANPGSIIMNNHINSSYNGITIATDGVLVANNTISNSRWAGIFVANGNNNEFYWNTLTNAGIIFNNGGAITPATNNTFRYNTINGGNQYWRGTGDGIMVWFNGLYNKFDFNIITVHRYGFKTELGYGNFTNTSITNNTIFAPSGCYYQMNDDTFKFNNTCNDVTRPITSFSSDTSAWYRIIDITVFRYFH